jgi:hypothetical protein
LPALYAQYDKAYKECAGAEKYQTEEYYIICEEGKEDYDCLYRVLEDKYDDSQLRKLVNATTNHSKEEVLNSAVSLVLKHMEHGNEGGYLKLSLKDNCENCVIAKEVLTTAGVDQDNIGSCYFKPLKLASMDIDRGITCSARGEGCVSYAQIGKDLTDLNKLLSLIELKPAQTKAETVGKGTAIGAAVGVGAGGLATAITALVESENINCRVGDNLGRVGFNKSYSIDRLKDLYVKWKLNLPDAQQNIGSGAITDKKSWADACAAYQLKDSATATPEQKKSDCESVQFYFKNASGAIEWIYSACTWKTDGAGNGTCEPTEVLLKSYGVAE